MMFNKHKVKQSHCKETETAYVVEYITRIPSIAGHRDVKKTAFLWKGIDKYWCDSHWQNLEDGELVTDAEQSKLGKIFQEWEEQKKRQKARKFRQELAKKVREELRNE